ncbi:MAG: Arc family DNA-binding protein [Pseudomonadota bacterium]
MEERPYRFLLRMPVELRDRLREAASTGGRSLNAELVHRLAKSLEAEAHEPAPDTSRPTSTRLRRALPSMEGRSMTRRTRQALFAVLLAGAAVAAIAAMVSTPGSMPTVNARAGGELGSALGAHLEQLREAVPGNQGMAEEGPDGAAADAYAARAFPDDVIELSDAAAARASFAAQQGRPFPRGKGRPGTWVTIGPSRALYPATPFRNAYNYVPAAYTAGGRTTDIAVADTCKPGDCRLYVTPAGGGVWTTKNGLAVTPHWEYLAGPLGINAAGSVTIDPNDPSGDTIYVGTGEANICGSGCVAGVGVYRSTDGGATWTGPLGGPATDTGNPLAGKGVGEILVQPGAPNVLYAATTTALRGMSGVCCSGVTRPVPGAAKWGLYKSTNGGASWTFIHNGAASAAACTGTITEYTNGGVCSPRGVRHIALDPNDPTHQTIYASSYARGVWRSTDGGTTWTQIKTPLAPGQITDRAAIAVASLPGGATRMYVYEGFGGGNPYSRLYRSDNANAGAPTFTDLTSPSTASPGFAWHNICEPQCWYDLFVHTPTGHPDIVYAGGDYAYGETVANKRAVILSLDGGVSGYDMTYDGTDELHPNGLHPDQHAIVTNPSNPLQFFETSDGGVMRSSGELVDRSAWCDDPNRGLTGASLDRCRQMLSKIPSRLEDLNEGLATLQWTRLTSSPHNVNVLQGGTQDNGTWETPGNPVKWENTMIGDGGWNGFDATLTDFRFHSFYDVSPEVNFEGGNIGTWIWIADPLFGHANSQFYAPIISDPRVSGTMFAGTGRTVYRTKTHGLGAMSYAEAQQHCNTWSGDYTVVCGDWAELGPTRLTSATWGDRAGGAVSAVERTAADTSTAWAATSTGRLFVSKNVDADPAASVAWTRLDDDATADPNRFVSGLYVDPSNANAAWVAYSGYGANTPSTPAHVFRVVYDPAAGTSTWTDLSYDWGDLPVTDVVRDDVTGDLYAASDFGVSVLKSGTTTWVASGGGLPAVEVASLDIRPSERILYAATHGLSAWRLNLD